MASPRNPKFASALAAVLSFLFCISINAADSTPTKLRGPALTIDDAVRIAKEFVQKRNLNVADSYIDSARLEQNRGGDRRKVWIVTWLKNEYINEKAIKGGQTYVHVYMDGTAEIFFGE